MNNDVYFSATPLASASAALQSNQIRAIAINSEFRNKEYPSIPTVKEQLGYSMLSKTYSTLNISKNMSERDFVYWKNFIIKLSMDEKFINDMNHIGLEIDLIKDRDIEFWHTNQVKMFKEIINKNNILAD